jgi:predicted nuclease of predicted toxin-antitoxin system
MPWVPLENPDRSEIGPEFKKKSRFLIDESLGVEVANYLREKGYNVQFAGDVGLTGRSDEDVFSYAWRENRMPWTHDHDFLDNTRFPEHRNPGVVVLPGGSGDQHAMVAGIGAALSMFGAAPSTGKKQNAW